MPRTGDVGVGGAVDLALHEADDRRSGLVERTHERSRIVAAEVAPPRLGDPVRIRVRERGCGRRVVGKPGEHRLDPVGEPAADGVRERHRALEPRPAHELHRLVHRRVARHPFDVAELVGGEPECRPHRRIEPRDPAPSEGLDRVVERTHALHGAERETLRERAIPLVEACGGRAERTVRVCVVLEDAADDLEGRRPRRPYGRSPRSHASYVIRLLPSGWTSSGSNAPSSPTRARQTVTGRPCSSARAPM